MRLSKDELITLSRLLDEAWELPAEARESWLESLGEPFRALRPTLRDLLARQARGETDGFLDALPKFTVAADETEQAAQAASVREGQIVGVYRLMREIGHGGMSTGEARRIQATHPELGEHYRHPLRELEARLRNSAQPLKTRVR
jgi:hypothetical protein